MPEIGQTLSHYRIVEKIGQGGMGEVYLADDTTLDRKVALKFLPEAFTSDPERMARFEREAKLLASLNHPNIAGIHGLEQADGNRFLVLEYVEGETLQARLSKGALSLEDALSLCCQIAEGLEAAHEKGVIHRDLKPANVMITAEEKVKILDFGLAKAFSEETQSIDTSQSPTLTEAMTRPGVILGTAAYMSPEQAKGKSVDKRADIWAFGCILYECLTGKKVFEGETVTETLASVIKEEPDWNALPANTPSNIRFVLRRCLEKERSRRLHDAADVRIEIEEVRDSDENTVATVKPRNLWVSRGIAAVLVMALAISIWALWTEEPLEAELIQFQIDYPDKTSPPEVGTFALSPDGRYLAFAAYDSGGVGHIWIREFSSLEAHPLPRITLRNPFFFWSPDSCFIAFDAGGELKKVDVDGGPSLPICDLLSTAVVGGSWNHDDVIIFGDFGGSNGIMQVPIADNVPLPVTKLDLQRKERWHILPTFLPDGRHFVYFRSSTIPEYEGLYIGSLDSKPEDQSDERLMASSWAAVYIPPKDSTPGQLLFPREQTLMAQQFDDKKLKLIGDPIPIADQIGSYENQGFFSATSDGKLAYRSSNIQLFQLTWFDRQGNVLGTVGEPGRFGGLDLSPDDHRAAISIDTSTQNSASPNIWVHDFVQGNDMPVTSDLERGISPVWSADGNRIIFSANTTGSANIYYVSLSGISSAKLLLKSDSTKHPNSYSSEGQYLLYTVADPKTKDNLWVMDKNGSESSFIATQYNERNGRFSPDMSYVAYVSDRTGIDEIYLCEFSPDSLEMSSEMVSSRPISRGGGGIEPRWSGDSKELYYRAPDGMLMVVEITAGTTFQASTPKPLFQTPNYISILGASPYPWDVTSDGKRFLLPAPVAESSPSPFNIILNWTKLLEQ